jgi:hypothetical protein
VLPATLPPVGVPDALPYNAACCDWGVEGSHPLLVIPSASIRCWSRSSVMTSKCSKAARRESSFAEQQWTYDLLAGLCSTMQAPIFLEEVGAKLITSRQRFGPYIARALAVARQWLNSAIHGRSRGYTPSTLARVLSSESSEFLSSMRCNI